MTIPRRFREAHRGNPVRNLLASLNLREIPKGDATKDLPPPPPHHRTEQKETFGTRMVEQLEELKGSRTLTDLPDAEIFSCGRSS